MSTTKHPHQPDVAQTAADPQYLALLAAAQSDLSAWAKSRFWFISILVSLTSVLGIYTIFQETLRSVLQEPAKDAIKSIDDRMQQEIIMLRSSSQREQDHVRLLYDASTAALAKTEAASDAVHASLEKEETQVDAAVASLKTSVTRSKGDVDQLSDQINDVDAKAKAASERLTKAVEINSENLSKSNSILEETRLIANETYKSGFDLENKVNTALIIAKKRAAVQTEIIDHTVFALGHFSDNITPDGTGTVRELLDFNKQKQDNFNTWLNNFNEINTYRVFVYIKKNEGLLRSANLAAEALIAVGFRVDTWLANGDTVDDAKADIAADFGVTPDALGSGLSALIVGSTSEKRVKDIQTALSGQQLFQNLHVTTADLHPDRKLTSLSNGMSIDREKAILIYNLSSQ